ncbi:uncharacterized protein LOC142178198 [Nicotiana tabacum]|uniref:Uncharacterized protein LOC142178198 n=1 Tax=Nicotiana tabacum TaxID=4097 RepID=A0AC58U2B7_TOBAC
MWDSRVYSIKKLASQAQCIHCHIIGKQNGVDCLVIVVYGFNTIEQRKTLWTQLNTLASRINKPWLICGDFNAILYPQDRLYGVPVTFTEIKNFADCYHNLSLSKIPWKGDYYTWSTKQQGSDRICSRLKKELANDEWMLSYGHLSTEYGEPDMCDHAPMIIQMRATMRNIKVPFRFFNIWAEHTQFKQLVEAGWARNKATEKMKNVWLKMKELKANLKKLNSEEFKGISEKITQEYLKDIQGRMHNRYSDSLAEQERECLQQLEKWSMIEESALQQKSRANWIKLGDLNNKYFSAVMKDKQQTKQMLEINSLQGMKLVNIGDIKKEILDFYKSLMGSTSV